MPGVEVLPRRGNVVLFSRAAEPERDARGRARAEAIARLRALLPRGSVLYAVRRAHDPGFGWIVCDFFRIEEGEIVSLTADVARALECFDPAREVGVKLRRARGADPLAEAIDGRLSTLLHGAPGALSQRLIP